MAAEAADSERENLLVLAGQVKNLYGLVSNSQLGNIACSIAIGSIMWPLAPHWATLGFVIGLCAVTAWRAALMRRYKREARLPEEALLWARRYVWTALGSGLAWAFAAMFLFIMGQSPALVLVAMIFGGCGISSMALNSAYLPAFYCFFLPPMAGFALRSVLPPHDLPPILALCMAGFAVVGVKVARAFNEASVRTIKLGLENIRLIGELKIYELMVRSISDPIIFINQQGLLRAANDACVKALSGRGMKDILGRSPGELSPFLGSILDPLLARCLAGQEARTAVWQEVPGRGKRFLDVRAYPLAGQDGAIHGAVVNVRDMTEAKQAEILREDVERLTRHDLKSPLGIITSMTDYLLETEQDLDRRDSLELILTAGNRMRGMLDLSMGLLRMEHGTFIFSPRPIALDGIIGRIAQGMRPIAEAKNITIAVRQDNGLVTPGEDILLHALFSNLVQNAIEAAPDNTRVSIDLVRAQDNSHIQVAIRNMGAVPESIRERFFDKYVTAGKRNGTGLGTYSARLIAKTHNGDIALDVARPGETTITVTLPAWQDAPTAQEPPERQAAA